MIDFYKKNNKEIIKLINSVDSSFLIKLEKLVINTSKKKKEINYMWQWRQCSDCESCYSRFNKKCWHQSD